MRVDDFDYSLPESLIARYPLAQRSASRLLMVKQNGPGLIHASFRDLLQGLEAGDLLVFNNTRVLPARLFGHKESGGKVEILLERLLDDRRCLAQVRASKSPKPGTLIQLGAQDGLRVTGRQGSFFELVADGEAGLAELLERHGHMPLPPYIEREDEALDQQRYQTVYAKVPGAVAAPTAGLHFDDDLLSALREKGVQMAEVTLHVGAGTYQPVRVERVEDHEMHAEYLEVSEAVCEQVKQTKASGKRVIAVGTTAVRALETAAAESELKPYLGDTRIFIYPGYEFRVIDELITNFHLPKSTLLMLVSALAGWSTIKNAYTTAVNEQYRFFSYGDAMWLHQRGKLQEQGDA